jgi:hypothetical protein
MIVEEYVIAVSPGFCTAVSIVGGGGGARYVAGAAGVAWGVWGSGDHATHGNTRYTS